MDSALEPTSSLDIEYSYLEQKGLCDLSGSSLALEKPLATPTSRFKRFSPNLPSIAIKNTIGLSILGLIVL